MIPYSVLDRTSLQSGVLYTTSRRKTRVLYSYVPKTLLEITRDYWKLQEITEDYVVVQDERNALSL